MARVVAEGSGIIVVLRSEADAGQLLRRMEDYRRPPARGASQASPATELRSYGVGAQILVDLGVRRMRVLGSPLKLHALSGFGLDVIEYIGDEP